jgi:hypothetical protein
VTDEKLLEWLEAMEAGVETLLSQLHAMHLQIIEIRRRRKPASEAGTPDDGD